MKEMGHSAKTDFRRMLQGIAVVSAAIICGYLLYLTQGKHGVGWFVVCLATIF